MPSPFSKKSEQPVERSTGARLQGENVDGEFYCEDCFAITTVAYYVAQAKRLHWNCVECGYQNVVRNFEL